MNNVSFYIKKWSDESDKLECLNVYDILSRKVPKGKILEIGCGKGISTNHLLKKTNDIIVIEKLEEFATKAKNDYGIEIIQNDLFNLTEEQIGILQNFNPDIIIGWFIGADGDTILNNVNSSNIPPNELGKKYRENVEDKIMELACYLNTVKYIHFSIRFAMPIGYDVEKIKEGQTIDYNEYVFKKNGFEVVDIDIIDWDNSISDFPYIHNYNPKCDGQQMIPKIVSLLAKRT